MEKLLEYAQQHHVPIIQQDGLSLINDYIHQHQYKTMLECGTAIGYSSINFVLSNPSLTIDTVELRHDYTEIAKANIIRFNLSESINVFHQDALIFTTDKEYDCIFIDSAKAQYRRVMERYLPNLKSGGSFIFDNMSFHGLVDSDEYIESRNLRSLVKKIRLFKEYLLTNPDFIVELHPNVGDGIAFVRLR